MSRRTQVLLHRWHLLLPGHETLGRDLLRRYAEPARAYHDQRHLAHILIMIDRLAAGSEDLRAVRLAAWFHDAVYAMTRTDNEEASALLADEELRRAGEPAPLAAEVARLVRLTARHDPAPGDAGGALLCDADMAILASGPQRYARYAAAVRREHAEIGRTAYALGRSAFLRATLEHPVFTTMAGRQLEPRARTNMIAELARLEGERP